MFKLNIRVELGKRELRALSSSNRGQKLAAIRRLGFRNSIIQFKRFSEKAFYLPLYFL
jgi:hypothetical protein